MPRTITWIDDQDFQGFGCSECKWAFRAAGQVEDESLEEMKRRYEAQRDKEFAAHVCNERPRPKAPKQD